MECPKCNYPNMDDAKICNDCGYDLQKESLLKVSSSNKSEERKDELKFGSTQKVDQQENKQQDADLRRTITDNEFNTPPLQEELNLLAQGEYNLQPVSLGSELSYSPIFFDNEIVVKRSIVDKNDYSISSVEHAKIYQLKGKWYLENKASNSAVFVKVKTGKRIRIDEGDIVLFGSNKFFEFQKTSQEKK